MTGRKFVAVALNALRKVVVCLFLVCLFLSARMQYISKSQRTFADFCHLLLRDGFTFDDVGTLLWEFAQRALRRSSSDAGLVLYHKLKVLPGYFDM